jgi:hypothetical protein
MFLRGDITKFEFIKKVGMYSSFLVITQFLLGCGTEFSSKKIGNTQPKDSRVKTESDDKNNSAANTEKFAVPEIKITGLDPFHYQAEINWSDKLKNVSVFSNGTLSFKTLSQGVTNCIFELDHNKEYKIQIYANSQDNAEAHFTTPLPIPKPKDNEDRELIQEWVIQTPLDIELSFLSIPFGFTFPLDIKAHRVFIDHEFPVVTNGFDLKIDTDELIILKKGVPDNLDPEAISVDSTTKTIKEAASIYTFSDEKVNEHATYDPTGRLISAWSDGKNGGHISVKAKTAVGALNIFLRGQNGADGGNGAPYTERAAQGPAGELADYDMFHCSRFTSKHICSCYKNEDRENGRQGAKGAPGRSGGNGGRGGDSGSVKIEIAEPSPNFKISTVSEFGLSGNPGKAGPPQQGGIGGPPVNKDDPFTIYMCRDAQPGPEGPVGDPGQDGVRQSNGVIEQNCISIGEGFGRCAN